MVEKIGRVNNPLTIIAIFAGIAEICGVVVLPSLACKNQNIFIWYVMFFPIMLVLLFYITLWKKHYVLYSPSDYRDDNNFMENARKNIKLEESKSEGSNFTIE